MKNMNVDQWFDSVSELARDSRAGKPKPVARIKDLYEQAAKLDVPTETLALIDDNWGE